MKTEARGRDDDEKRTIIAGLVSLHREFTRYEELINKINSTDDCDAAKERRIENLKFVKNLESEFQRCIVKELGGTRDVLSYLSEGKKMIDQHRFKAERELKRIEKKKKKEDLENEEKKDLEKKKLKEKEKEGGHGQKKHKKKKKKKQLPSSSITLKQPPSPTKASSDSASDSLSSEPSFLQKQPPSPTKTSSDSASDSLKQPPSPTKASSNSASEPLCQQGVVELGILKRLTDDYERLVMRLNCFGDWDVEKEKMNQSLKKFREVIMSGSLAEVVAAQGLVQQRIVEAEKGVKTGEKKIKEEHKTREKEEKKKEKEKKKKKKEKEDLEKKKDEENSEKKKQKGGGQKKHKGGGKTN